MTWEGYDPWYVYELIDPRGEVVFYIGKTNTPAQRFSQHRHDRQSAAHYPLRVIAEAGYQAKMNVIGTFKTEAEALDYESYLIDRTPGLVNRTGAYARGERPTKPLIRPVILGEHDTYSYGLDDEAPVLRRRARALYEAIGGTVSEEDITRVLEALDLLAHEDAEYELPTDE